MGSIGTEGRGHGNQFWDAICYNRLWHLMGHKFGCMIASHKQFDSRGGFSGSSYPTKTYTEIECQRVVAMATSFGTKIAVNWLW